MMRSPAPIARKPNSAFSHAPSSSTRLPARPFEEPNAESQHSADSAVQASPESSLPFPQNLTTIPLHRPGDPIPAESAPPSVNFYIRIGLHGDQHKPEAARTAAKITSSPEQSVQREAMPEEEDKELQRLEEDDELQRSPEDSIQRQSEEDDELQMRIDTSTLQRQPQEEEEDLQMKSENSIQRQPISPNSPAQVGRRSPEKSLQRQPAEEDEELQAKPKPGLQLRVSSPNRAGQPQLGGQIQ
ncbi:MAG: hypothetical protein ACFB8W_06930, partial [Elainellaceae cyanobacterium]